MFVSADTMAFMMSLGLSGDQLVELFRKLEDDARAMAPAPKERTGGAERQARLRERRKQSVTSDVTSNATCDVTPLPLSPSSPRPPSTTNPNLVPPYSPPTAKPAEPDLKAIAEAIWRMQPVVGGKRKATRPDVLKALRGVDRRGHDPRRAETACQAYYRLPDCRKDGGQFAKGAAVLLTDDRWMDFEPTSANRERPSPKAEPAVYAAHVRHYRDTGEWKPSWGEKPNLEDAA